MFCSKCGASLAADSAFCRNCGAAVAGAVVVASAPAGGVSPHAGVGAIAYALGVVYAGFWLRFVAFVIDRLILGIASVALFIPFFFLIGGAAILERVPWRRMDNPNFAELAPLIFIIAVFAGVALVVQWLYFAYLESGEKQATWGKQAMSIYVTDLEGKRVTFGRASGRYFAKIVTGLIPLAIGYIMAGFTERRQALHDMIASTLVLRR